MSQAVLLSSCVLWHIVSSQSTHTYTCNVADDKLTSYTCPSGSICTIRCTASRCFETPVIYASLASSLTIEASAEKCFEDATIHTPINGSTTLTGSGSESLSTATVNPSENAAQSIVINCNGGIATCKDLRVNAQNAQYLEINIGSGSDLAGESETYTSYASIYCPTSSSYTASAPCIINVASGAGGIYDAMHNVGIYTVDGVPKDVWIENPALESITTTTVYCSSTSSSATYPFGVNGNCWNTRAPTTDPTGIPSISPTQPTLAPSSAPTDSTADPTTAPTRSPLQPTNNPSTAPSDAQSNTDAPSNAPTKTPTDAPSKTPADVPSAATSRAPSVAPTEAPSTEDDQGEDTDNGGTEAANSDSGIFASGTVVIVVLANLVVCLLCGIIGYFVFKRYIKRKLGLQRDMTQQGEKDTEDVEMGSEPPVAYALDYDKAKSMSGSSPEVTDFELQADANVAEDEPEGAQVVNTMIGSEPGDAFENDDETKEEYRSNSDEDKSKEQFVQDSDEDSQKDEDLYDPEKDTIGTNGETAGAAKSTAGRTRG